MKPNGPSLVFRLTLSYMVDSLGQKKDYLCSSNSALFFPARVYTYTGIDLVQGQRGKKNEKKNR